MNITLCDDHFKNLKCGIVCTNCPSKLENERFIKVLSEANSTMSPDDQKTLIDAINNVEARLGSQIKETRSEFLLKFDRMEDAEQTGVKDLYRHIDRRLSEMSSSLDGSIKEITNDIIGLKTGQAQIKTKFTILGSAIGLLSAGFIAFLFNHFSS